MPHSNIYAVFGSDIFIALERLLKSPPLPSDKGLIGDLDDRGTDITSFAVDIFLTPWS